jgi:hypothetical protein
MKNLLYIPVALIFTMIITSINLQAQQLHNTASGRSRARVIAKVITIVSESRDSIVSWDGGSTWLPATSVAPASLQESIRFSDRQKSDAVITSDRIIATASGHDDISAGEMRAIPAAWHQFEMAFLSTGSAV